MILGEPGFNVTIRAPSQFGNPCMETTLSSRGVSNLQKCTGDALAAMQKLIGHDRPSFPEGAQVRWHMPVGGFAVVQIRCFLPDGYVHVVHHSSGALLRIKSDALHELSPLEKLALCADDQG